MVPFLRRVFLVWLATCAVGVGLVPRGPAQDVPPPAAGGNADRAALVAERYRALLHADPREGLALDRLWKFHEERGTTAELVKSYRDAAAAPDADVPTLLVDGYLLKKTGQPEAAAALFTRAAGRDAADPLPALALGDLAAAREQAADAARWYGEAVGKLRAGDRRQADLLIKQGNALFAAGENGEAAAVWEKVAALSPADFALRRRLADADEKNGLPDRAVAQYEYIQSHAGPEERALAWRELARLHEAQGQFDAAREALESGLALMARDNWLHGDLQTRLIRLYGRAGRAPELAARWRAEVARAPRDLGGYLRLAALAEAAGDAGGQREALEKVVALNGRDRESARRLAALLAQAGERARAGELYDTLLQAQPGNLGLLLARAELDVQLGHVPDAVNRLEARVAQSPADESVATPVLEFFLSHRLDEPAERRLRAEVARQPGAAEASLALAKFLFSQRRGDEARAVLAACAAQPGDEAARANRLSQVAEAYQQGAAPDDALRSWREVAALQPANVPAQLALADLARARGDLAGAVASLEQAAALSAPGSARLAVERRLFDTLRADAPVPDGGRGRPAAALPAADSALGAYLRGLTQTAARQGTADAYLRLARWLSWARNPAGALAAAGKALDLEGDNVPALELSAALAAEARQPDRAERMLSALVQADPAHSDAAQRELANLRLQTGDTQAALELFQRLQSRAPGSRAALADLALAQQRAERWVDALATWQQAEALPGGTPTQRAETRRRLLAAYERLGQFPQAVAALIRSVDEGADLPAKEDLFRQLVDLARQHGLLAQVSAPFEERLRRKPDDEFNLVAVARLRRENGDPAAGYALLQKALFSTPDPAGSLARLVQEAETLGATGDAVNYQRRLTVLPGRGTAENLARLADLQAADQDPAAARDTWNDLAARFPRDPAALCKAAAFFEQTGDLNRACELARTAVRLDEADLPGVLRLAALEERAGDVPAALADDEAVLDRTRPEAPGEGFLPPEELRLPADGLASLATGGGRFRLRPPGPPPGSVPALAPPPAGGDQVLRLQAITAASRLLFADSGASDARRAAWLARWRKAAEEGCLNEPLSAFYAAGDQAATMRLLTGRLERSHGEDAALAGAFVLAGLHLGAERAVGQWVWADSARPASARVGVLSAGLERYLGAGGKPRPGLIPDLFPPTVDRQDLLWDAAKEFAGLHWYAPAAELGRRLLDLKTSERGAYAVEVADWELYGGSAARARDALRLAIEEGSGTTFDASVNPNMAALRQYYLLLPATERPAFVTDYLPRLRARGDRVQALLAGALLHGLAGDEAAAGRELDALLAARLLANDFSAPSPEANRWAYLLANGVQLQSWNLDSLAARLWRHALQEANAFDRQSGEAEGRLAEIRRRLVALDVARAESPEEARAAVAAYLDTDPPTGTAASVAGELLNEARYGAAIQIDEHLCRAEPGDPEHWRTLFTAYEAAGEPDALERALAGLFEGPDGWPEGLPRTDFVCRWAAVRERNGDSEGAGRVLEKERADFPGTLPVLLQLAQTYAREGHHEQAAAVWREVLPLDASGTAAVGLAEAKARQGHREEAGRLLRDALAGAAGSARSRIAGQLAEWYVGAGQLDEARKLGERLLSEELLEPLPALASGLAKAGQDAAARSLLTAAVWRARDPDTRYQMQEALLGLLPPVGGDPRPFLRQLARLESFAREVPTLRNNFEAARYKLLRAAGADGSLEPLLALRWQAGKGDYLAGERLAAFYIDTQQPGQLREVIDQFNHRPMLPDQLLFGIEKALVQAGHASLALPISERLCRRFPQNPEFALQRATALWQAGEREEAGHVLATLAATTVLHDDLPEKIALLYLGLGDVKQATAYFERVVRDDPLAESSPGSFLQLAQLDLDAGRRQEAERLLRTAYRQDATGSFEPLVNFLAATGQLDGGKAVEMPAEDFPLSFRRRARLLGAVAGRLRQDGRAREARELWWRHAPFLAEVPAVAAELCHDLPEPEKSRWLEEIRQATDQTQPPYPRLLRLLTSLEGKNAGGEKRTAGAVEADTPTGQAP